MGDTYLCHCPANYKGIKCEGMAAIHLYTNNMHFRNHERRALGVGPN